MTLARPTRANSDRATAANPLAGLLALGRPVVMGVLNVTPDSFSDGGLFFSDVLGGYAVAALVLVPMCWAYARWRLATSRRRFKR